MRCRKHDEGDKGCIKEAGHLARCTIRPHPDDPTPETWPCAEEGCDRRVKTDGARCPVHRGMLNRGVRRGSRPGSARPDVGDRRAHRRGRNVPAPPLRPAAPNDATGAGSPGVRPAGGVRDGRGLVARRIEALTVQDVIANKAARKVLVGLARAILATFDKPEPKAV